MYWSEDYAMFSDGTSFCGMPVAQDYFFRNIIEYISVDCKSFEWGDPTHVVGWLYFCSFLVWSIIYFSVFMGVKSSSYVVWVTVPLPMITVLVLLIRGATLEGAGDGVRYYLTGQNPDPDVVSLTAKETLEQPAIWVDAAS